MCIRYVWGYEGCYHAGLQEDMCGDPDCDLETDLGLQDGDCPLCIMVEAFEEANLWREFMQQSTGLPTVEHLPPTPPRAEFDGLRNGQAFSLEWASICRLHDHVTDEVWLQRSERRCTLRLMAARLGALFEVRHQIIDHEVYIWMSAADVNLYRKRQAMRLRDQMAQWQDRQDAAESESESSLSE